MFDAAYYAGLGLEAVREKVLAGLRLSPDEGLQLFRCPDPLAVGALAHHVRTLRHGRRGYYVVNRHVNYTNHCINACLFCAFRREPGEAGSFTLSHEEIAGRLCNDPPARAAAAPPVPDELHIVGGCHPSLPLSWFEALLGKVHAQRPNTRIKAFTCVEIAHFAALEGISTIAVLQRLKAAGLAMLPGGGAEIFAPRVRKLLCPHKADAETWLRISGEAHALGIPTNATMLFGHVEQLEERVDHLCRLREQQDRSGGFTCFIALPFQTEHSALKLPDKTGPERGLDQLRTLAVSRLMLDNFPHIKAYLVMLGLKQAQNALYWGADDLDGTVVEEKIGHMAGADSAQALSTTELEEMLRLSGFEPVRRNADFSEFAGTESPLSTSRAARTECPHTAARSPFTAYAAADIARAAAEGQRLTRAQAELLYRESDLHTLGLAAHTARLRLHPEPVVTYVGDRNINYSNICVCGCRFCAFFRPPGHAEGYVLNREVIAEKIEQTLALGGTQILLQGGHHPGLPLTWYVELLAWMRGRWPTLHIHAFSPPEIVFWARREGISFREVLRRLRAGGLDSVPGGGAETLADAVRTKVSPNKCTTAEWLDVMEETHALGLKSTATMMFGHEEETRHRLDHLFALRDLQDRTGGFTAFIPWTFQPEHTAIARQPESAPSYLRLLALSRLTLDNIPNIQASWVTMGPQSAQLALFFGANDFGSLMIEENVVAAAGVSFSLNREEIHRIILAAGFEPVQRAMDYTRLHSRKDKGPI